MSDYTTPLLFDPTTAKTTLDTTNTLLDDTDSPYDVLSTDRVLLVDPTANPVTINLPQVSSTNTNRVLIIKDRAGSANTNNITLTPFGADTIDGGNSLALSVNYNCVTLQSDGTSNWTVVSLF